MNLSLLKCLALLLPILISVAYGGELPSPDARPILLARVFKYDKKGKLDRSETSSLVLYRKANGDMKHVQVRVYDEKGKEDKSERENVTNRNLRGDGTVIKSQMGVNVISLRSSNSSDAYGGDIVVDFLKKWGGLFGSNTRDSITIQLDRTPEDNWRLVHNGTPLNQIKFHERKDGSKGIQRVRFARSKRKSRSR